MSVAPTEPTCAERDRGGRDPPRVSGPASSTSLTTTAAPRPQGARVCSAERLARACRRRPPVAVRRVAQRVADRHLATSAAWAVAHLDRQGELHLPPPSTSETSLSQPDPRNSSPTQRAGDPHLVETLVMLARRRARSSCWDRPEHYRVSTVGVVRRTRLRARDPHG